MAWQTPKTNWQAADVVSKDDFNRIEGNVQELQNTKETPAGAQAKVNTHAGSKQTHGISSGYYIAKTSRSDQLPAWNDIQGKPSLVTSSDLSNGLAAKVNKPSSATSGNIAVFDGGPGKLKDGGKINDLFKFYAGEDIELLLDEGASAEVTSSTFTKLKEYRILFGSGSLRIKFTLGPTGSSSANIEGQIYRNSIAVGTLRRKEGSGGTIFTEDIDGWKSGDLLQIYGRRVSAYGSCKVKDISIGIKCLEKLL